MSAAQHTRVRWIIFERSGKIEVHTDFGDIVCEFFGNQKTDRANARLIAAAPETAAERDRLRESNAESLAALKELERIVSAHPSFQNEWTHAASVVGSARAAIAKAKGGAS